MCDDGQASYKEPWRCTTPLNKLINTMPMVSHGRLVGLTQRLARTQMWFATANPTAGAPPSAQAIYADAWNEACAYVISDKKLLAGSALNDGLRKLKQAVDDLEGEAKDAGARIDQAPSGPFVGPSSLGGWDPLKQLASSFTGKRGRDGGGDEEFEDPQVISGTSRVTKTTVRPAVPRRPPTIKTGTF